jgi:pimeloyl-ACP methyl ester carboxylesterase
MTVRNSKLHRACLVIPGLGEKPNDRSYLAVRWELEYLGWRVVPVKIDWSRTTLTDWLHQAEKIATKVGPIDIVFGFSFGAMIALLLASKTKISTIIAASPSPYFRECLASLPPLAEKMLGPRRMRDFEKYSLTELKKIRSRHVEILVGSDDFPPLIAMTKKLLRILPSKAELTMIPGAPHDLGDERYVTAVKKVLATVSKR